MVSKNELILVIAILIFCLIARKMETDKRVALAKIEASKPQLIEVENP